MDYLTTDVDLNNMLQSDVGLWPFIYDATIVDNNGKALLHTKVDMVGKFVPLRPDFSHVVNAHFLKQLRIIYSPAAVYEVGLPIKLNEQPFGTIRIGVSTVFLKSELTQRLLHSVYFSIASIFVSLLLAAEIPIWLGPLRTIARNLDSATAGETEALYADESRHDELGWWLL